MPTVQLHEEALRQSDHFPSVAESSGEQPSSILLWPRDATFDVWRKPTDPKKFVPNTSDCQRLHASEVIGDRGVILVCFAQTLTSDYPRMHRALTTGINLGFVTLMVSIPSCDNEVACAFHGTESVSQHHGMAVTGPLMFTPSQTLARILGISGARMRIKNALILLQDGRVVAQWVESRETDPHNPNDLPEPFDWSAIKTAV